MENFCENCREEPRHIGSNWCKYCLALSIIYGKPPVYAGEGGDDA